MDAPASPLADMVGTAGGKVASVTQRECFYEAL